MSSELKPSFCATASRNLTQAAQTPAVEQFAPNCPPEPEDMGETREPSVYVSGAGSYARVPLADGTLVATSEMPADDRPLRPCGSRTADLVELLSANSNVQRRGDIPDRARRPGIESCIKCPGEWHDTDPFAQRLVDSIGNRRANRWNARLAYTRRRIGGGKDMNLHHRHRIDP